MEDFFDLIIYNYQLLFSYHINKPDEGKYLQSTFKQFNIL